LLVDSVGDLLGVTITGGNFGGGVAYRLSAGNWGDTVLYNFCSQGNCSDGQNPYGPLTQDSAGNLYGTTVAGGLPCRNAGLNGLTCGVVYKLAPDGDTYQQSVLYSFCVKSDCKDGAQPSGSLALDSAGNLFGTTAYGGGNDAEQGGTGGGVAYELSGTSLRVLYRFCAEGGDFCTDGEMPLSGLTRDASGKLFGTTLGNVFRIKP